MPALYLIRHGHTEYSDLGAIAGSSDVALSQAGRDAVTVAAGSLDIDSITTFHASTLTRAIDTASLLGGDTIVEDARLVELDFGDWEGKTWQQVHDDDPDHLSEWSENWVERAPPGGETFQALANRADDWLQDIKALPDDHRLVVAAHGGTIRALLCLAHAANLPHTVNPLHTDNNSQTLRRSDSTHQSIMAGRTAIICFISHRQ